MFFYNHLHISLLLTAGTYTLLDLPILCLRKPLINRNCLPSTSDHTSVKSVVEWMKIRVWVRMCSTHSLCLTLDVVPALLAYSSTCQNTLCCPRERFYTFFCVRIYYSEFARLDLDATSEPDHPSVQLLLAYLSITTLPFVPKILSPTCPCTFQVPSDSWDRRHTLLQTSRAT
jgi:hypothetical protein